MRVSLRLLGLAGLLCAAQPSFAVEQTEIRPQPRPGTEPPAVELAAAPAPAPTTIEDLNAAEPELLQLLSARVPLPRPEALLEGHEFRLALRAARRGDWGTARALAERDSPVAADIIDWQRLRSGRGSFPEYLAFLERNGDWPGLKLMRRRGERAITEADDPAKILAFFEAEPPQTGYGALRRVEAYAALGKIRESRAELVKAWQSLEMTAAEETAYLSAFPDALSPHHAERLDDALWRRDRESARRMLARVDDDTRALAQARLALQARTGNADRLWRSVPETLARDPGLARDRMRWLVATKRRSEAGDLIIAQSTTRARLGRPEAWSDQRRSLARQEMRAGNPRRAYQLASTHFTDGGSDYADLEWLSGFLALRYLDRPKDALTHFRHFRSEIFTPISLGRAGYWEGRALDAMGEAEMAQAAYRDAAQHQTSFYGLLAAEAAGVPMDPALTGAGAPAEWQAAGFTRSSVFAAAQLMFEAGQQYEVTRFLRHLSEITPKDELVALGDFTASLGDPYISVRVGKRIARDGAVAIRAYYPLTDLGPESLPVDPALALSIARRESEFFPTAVSGAGARGLMQLMPATAREMSRDLGLPYRQARLTSDPVYNARLGSAYLANLIERYGDNVVLVSVGYNAGPGRADSWTKSNGDVRTARVDVIDWIEHIPFNETRNYVMRVAESLVVYRARVSGQTAPIEMMALLTKR